VKVAEGNGFGVAGLALPEVRDLVTASQEVTIKAVHRHV
jgi:hypothetical protein